MARIASFMSPIVHRWSAVCNAILCDALPQPEDSLLD